MNIDISSRKIKNSYEIVITLGAVGGWHGMEISLSVEHAKNLLKKLQAVLKEIE